jgi:hypothetical protein
VRREQLEHLVRAASAIANQRRFVVVGSQSVLGQFPEAPAGPLTMSMEADLIPIDSPQLADLIDGTIGEGSSFHELYGYYAQGLDLASAILPRGWEGRLTEINNANTGGASAYCIEVHDLALSKYAAGRPKDLAFIAALIAHGYVKKQTLLERVGLMPEGVQVAAIRGRIERDFVGRHRKS